MNLAENLVEISQADLSELSRELHRTGRPKDILVWLATHHGLEVAEAARFAVESAALAAMQSPLAYPWVGAVFRALSKADKSYRRTLAWDARFHVYYGYLEAEDRVVVLHVRGVRQRPLTLRKLVRS
jgi:hypothetical protein